MNAINGSMDSTTKMTELENYINTLKTQTTSIYLYLFCCSISIFWTVYIMFFNSRILGIIITFLLNNLYFKYYFKNVYVKVSSLSISILAGKIMFRSVHYVTMDYTCYIQDGYLQFAFWRPQYVVEEQSKAKITLSKTTKKGEEDDGEEGGDEEVEHEEMKRTTKASNIKLINSKKKKVARLEIMLNNLQMHYYNSWKQNYDVKTTSTKSSHHQQAQNTQSTITSSVSSNSATANDSQIFKEHLMYLFSIVNIRIQKGRIYFGNNLNLNSILAVKFSNSKLELVTETSQSKVDDYCYILAGDVTKLDISFLVLNSNKDPFKLFVPGGGGDHKKLKNENRILIMRSLACNIKYIQDIPTILTFERRRVLKTINGELVHDNKEPQWSLIVNCTNQTVLNYGPWYDRQREQLWKYFFPPAYETLEPQASPQLNERRQISKFDLILNIKENTNSEINLFFKSDKSETQDKKLVSLKKK